MKRPLEDKILALNALKQKILRLKSQRKKVVFTNGCFDLLHWGHIKYLQDAANKGDLLVVGVNSDSSVKRLKGKNRPLVNEKDRLRMIAGLECVDYVVLFKEDTPLKIIKLLKPDVLVKGADWNKNNMVGRDIVLSNGGSVSTIKFVRGYSTSHLIKKIAERF